MRITVREKDVESYLVKRLEAAGIPCLKFHPDDKVGMPDRIILLPGGRVLWAELKTDEGRLSSVQQYRHKQLVAAGQEVVVIWNKAQADRLVDRCMGSPAETTAE